MTGNPIASKPRGRKGRGEHNPLRSPALTPSPSNWVATQPVSTNSLHRQSRACECPPDKLWLGNAPTSDSAFPVFLSGLCLLEIGNTHHMHVCLEFENAEDSSFHSLRGFKIFLSHGLQFKNLLNIWFSLEEQKSNGNDAVVVFWLMEASRWF